MATTFAELGIPFLLFAAPVKEAREYEGIATCSLCAQRGHCFELGSGSEVVIRCPGCGRANAVAGDERSGACAGCAQRLAIANPEAQLRACYACLRRGDAALTKSTELGMICWEDAVQGSTQGVPTRAPGPGRVFLAAPDGAVAVAGEAEPEGNDDGEDGWTKVELEREWMFELLRTPAYATWQGDSWLFHEKVPMVYLGTWGRKQFSEHAEDGDGERLFRQLVESPPSGRWSDWLGEDRGDDGIAVYVFRSQDGSVLKAYYDVD